jgi:hypothetical protein
MPLTRSAQRRHAAQETASLPVHTQPASATMVAESPIQQHTLYVVHVQSVDNNHAGPTVAERLGIKESLARLVRAEIRDIMMPCDNGMQSRVSRLRRRWSNMGFSFVYLKYSFDTPQDRNMAAMAIATLVSTVPVDDYDWYTVMDVSAVWLDANESGTDDDDNDDDRRAANESGTDDYGVHVDDRRAAFDGEQSTDTSESHDLIDYGEFESPDQGGLAEHASTTSVTTTYSDEVGESPDAACLHTTSERKESASEEDVYESRMVA